MLKAYNLSISFLTLIATARPQMSLDRPDRLSKFFFSPGVKEWKPGNQSMLNTHVYAAIYAQVVK